MGPHSATGGGILAQSRPSASRPIAEQDGFSEPDRALPALSAEATATDFVTAPGRARGPRATSWRVRFDREESDRPSGSVAHLHERSRPGGVLAEWGQEVWVGVEPRPRGEVGSGSKPTVDRTRRASSSIGGGRPIPSSGDRMDSQRWTRSASLLPSPLSSPGSTDGGGFSAQTYERQVSHLPVGVPVRASQTCMTLRLRSRNGSLFSVRNR
jgi:hypothetical protein